jgi:hypothetical protein
LVQNYLVYSPIDCYEQPKHILGLLCCPRIGFYNVIKLYRSWNTGPIAQPMNQWGNQEDSQVIWQQTPIHRISPICVHLNCLESGKDDSSLEVLLHLQSSKTDRGSHSDPELNIFVKIFEFYHDTCLIFSQYRLYTSIIEYNS